MENTIKSCGDPELSIVVGIIAGGQRATETCLAALEHGAIGVRMECIVPFDARLDGVEQLRARFPWAQFIDARTHVDWARFGKGSREHHDILRAIGLREARGRIVALLEDHGTPSPDWCQAVLKAHEGSATAVGGAVENGVDRLLNWAVYYCDFGRYQNPVPNGPAEFLSDSNVSYKREALFALKDQWHDAFHETSINWELARRGHTLKLDPAMVVHQTRTGLYFGGALHERFVWGRSFAGTRAKEISLVRRAIMACLSWLLPLLLTARIVRNGMQRKRLAGKLLASLPLILLLQTFWALGELVGYVTGHTGGPLVGSQDEKPGTTTG